MRTERKKAVQRTTSSRLWAKVRPAFVFGVAVLLGVLVGTLVGGSAGFAVGSITAASAFFVIGAGVLWIEARTTRNSSLMHELRSVNWLYLTGRFWLVAALLLGIPLLVNVVLFRFLDGSVMKVVMLLEAFIVYLLVRRYADVFASWITQNKTSPDKE